MFDFMPLNSGGGGGGREVCAAEEKNIWKAYLNGWFIRTIYKIKCSISSELQYSSHLMKHLHVVPSLMLIHLFPIFKQRKSQPWIRLPEK